MDIEFSRLRDTLCANPTDDALWAQYEAARSRVHGLKQWKKVAIAGAYGTAHDYLVMQLTGSDPLSGDSGGVAVVEGDRFRFSVLETPECYICVPNCVAIYSGALRECLFWNADVVLLFRDDAEFTSCGETSPSIIFLDTTKLVEECSLAFNAPGGRGGFMAALRGTRFFHELRSLYKLSVGELESKAGICWVPHRRLLKLPSSFPYFLPDHSSNSSGLSEQGFQASYFGAKF